MTVLAIIAALAALVELILAVRYRRIANRALESAQTYYDAAVEYRHEGSEAWDRAYAHRLECIRILADAHDTNEVTKAAIGDVKARIKEWTHG